MFQYNFCVFEIKAIFLKLICSCFFVGFHENIVAYYSSWFENEQLYIQMELCDHSLSTNKVSHLITEGEVLKALHQVCILADHIQAEYV